MVQDIIVPFTLYCNTLWTLWNWSIILGTPSSFSALTLLVGSFDLWKLIPDKTYVFGEMLNLTQLQLPFTSDERGMFLVSWDQILQSWILRNKRIRDRQPLSTAKIRPIIRYVSEMVQYRRQVRSKSHTSFPLVPKSVTFNDFEWCNSHYFA